MHPPRPAAPHGAAPPSPPSPPRTTKAPTKPFALALSAVGRRAAALAAVDARPAPAASAAKATPTVGAQPPLTAPRPEATVDRPAADLAALARDRARERAERPSSSADEPARDEIVLDPSARSLAQLAPPSPPAPVSASEAPPPARALDPALMAAVVETAAFWGDGARGLARLRFGHRARGGLSGATVTLVQDDGAVAVRVEGADDAVLDRLRDRLATAGIAVDPER